jgi:hypothetical protein
MPEQGGLCASAEDGQNAALDRVQKPVWLAGIGARLPQIRESSSELMIKCSLASHAAHGGLRAYARPLAAAIARWSGSWRCSIVRCRSKASDEACPESRRRSVPRDVLESTTRPAGDAERVSPPLVMMFPRSHARGPPCEVPS